MGSPGKIEQALEMSKIYLLSLGCPRNMNDSELLLSMLEKEGFSVTDDPVSADAAIVNTCGFVEDAKRESIDVILRLAELKKKGDIERIVVTGCLSQRYPSELMDQIGEIDAVFGTSDFLKIPSMLGLVFSGKRIKEVNPEPDFLDDGTTGRKILTPPHYTYVKIQEGCSNRCSYCVIPALKGRRRSRTPSSIITEVRRLVSSGEVRELILIGQDTTSYGMDLGREVRLPALLREVCAAAGNTWVRLLYTHPAHFTDELTEVVSETPNLLKYIDLPVQHINDRILREMNRSVSGGEARSLINGIRRRIKGVALRTSVIVGFPGETEKEFSELLDFLKEVRFERLGAFVYSREEGSAAADMPGQVPDALKKERFDRVMTLQRDISAENNASLIGNELDVLIDEPAGEGRYAGRSYMDAPEVDGGVFVLGEGLSAGDLVKARITGAMEYDLVGELTDEPA
ncbi:MAG: 30S ribosomal protein S12 methylthiotransferase RimO [Candidatus Omnitrophica bacterium]|nr:30S ribosomal protein S12 methylthiotransferase RimO [Candidatus Omnitrophota bacterium]